MCTGIQPGWEERHFPVEERRGRLRLVASPSAEDDALTIHQDVRVMAANLDGDPAIEHPLDAGRGAWLQVARGSLTVNGIELAEGDGLAIEDEPSIVLSDGRQAEVLLFDMA